MSSEELYITNDDNPQYAELFAPGIVKMVASPDTTTKIDPRLFPISEQQIADMPNYLDRINNIIVGGELNAISPEKLKQIQALIRGSNSSEEINQIEMTLNLNEKVWIHFYMKWLRRDEELTNFRDFLGDATNQAGIPSPESEQRVLGMVNAQLGMQATIDRIMKAR